MNKLASKLNPKDPKALIAIGLVLLAGAYVFASLAIDSGSLWYYLATFIALIYGIKYLFRPLTSSKSHGKKG
jgi:hypothetical protein